MTSEVRGTKRTANGEKLPEITDLIREVVGEESKRRRTTQMVMARDRIIDDYTRTAVELEERGEWRRVVSHWTRVIEEIGDPDSAESSFTPIRIANLYYNRAVAYIHLEDYHCAIRDLTIALGKDPGNMDSLYQRGFAKMKLADIGALDDFRGALSGRETHAAAEVHIAFEQGRFQEVVDKTVPESWPEEWENRGNIFLTDIKLMRGIALRELQRYQEAIIDLTKGIRYANNIFPKGNFLADLHLMRADVHRIQKNEEAAKNDFDRCRELYHLPETFSAINNPIAVAMRDALIPHVPKRREAIIALAHMYRDGLHGLAVDVARRDQYYCMAMDAECSEAELIRANMFLQIKDCLSAAEYFKKIIAVTNHRDRAEAAYQLGMLYEEHRILSNNDESAQQVRAMYMIAVNSNPPHPLAMNRLGEFYYKGHIHSDGTIGGHITEADYLAAFDLFQRAYIVEPNKGLFACNIGLCYFFGRNKRRAADGNNAEKKDYNLAYRYFREAAEKGHRDADLFQRLSIMSYHGQGCQPDYRAALRYAELWRELKPEALAHFYSGLISLYGTGVRDNRQAVRHFNDLLLVADVLALNMLKKLYIREHETLDVQRVTRLLEDKKAPVFHQLHPSVAANGHGDVVLYYQDSDRLLNPIIRIETALFDADGNLTPVSSNWIHPNAVNKSYYVAINNNRNVVVIRQNGTSLEYARAQLDPETRIVKDSFTTFNKYDDGEEPAVAISDVGRVVEVHSSENYQYIYSRCGYLFNKTVEWGSSIKLSNVKLQRPSVAIRGNNILVVAESCTENRLWFRAGGIRMDKSGSVFWGNSTIFIEKPDSCQRPQITFVEPNRVLLVMEIVDSGLLVRSYFRCEIKLECVARGVSVNEIKFSFNLSCEKNNWRVYDVGGSPVVAAANGKVIEFHEFRHPLDNSECPTLCRGKVE